MSISKFQCFHSHIHAQSHNTYMDREIDACAFSLSIFFHLLYDAIYYHFYHFCRNAFIHSTNSNNRNLRILLHFHVHPPFYSLQFEHFYQRYCCIYQKIFALHSMPHILHRNKVRIHSYRDRLPHIHGR